MKCLTIAQPYAELIVSGEKKVENRTWPTSYRGPLLIHAGKSRKFLSGDNYGITIESMVFGAIIGSANLVDCFQVPLAEFALRKRPWLAGHQHVEGPWCFVLTECRRFTEPIEYRGAQGFFDVPNEVVAEAFKRCETQP